MPAAECTFERRQLEQERWIAPPDLQATWEMLDVRFGDVAGKKYIYRQSAPVFRKGVDYVLCVPGGYATVMLCGSGADFDETPSSHSFIRCAICVGANRRSRGDSAGVLLS